MRRRAIQVDDREAADDAWTEFGLVFTTGYGTPIEPRNFNRSFAAACDRAGVRRIAPHHVRHTTKTFLRVLGVDLRMIKEILGHADVTVTSNIYVHVDEQSMREALERLEEHLAG